MSKTLTIQELKNSILSSYKLGENEFGSSSASCKLDYYYSNPQEFYNYDYRCALNNIPNFMDYFTEFDYKNVLGILNNVAKKRLDDDNKKYRKDYSNRDNFIYYDETNKVRTG